MPAATSRLAPASSTSAATTARCSRPSGPPSARASASTTSSSGAIEEPRYRLLPGRFPDDLPADVGTFDVVTMLALFEHVPVEAQKPVVAACRSCSSPAALAVLTVPSPAVDPMLDVMAKVRIIDGLSHDQHHGFKPADLGPLFEAGGFRTVVTKRFQLGLNNLFVFQAA